MHIALLILIGLLLIFLLKRETSRRFTEESFLSIVNHTFRTPLTRIKWMSDSLKEDLPRKETLEIAHNLSNSVDRLLEIVDILAGIQDIHDTSAYHLKAVSIREILEDAIRTYHVPLNEKKITLSMPPFHDMPLLSIDTKKISLVIHIILENAIFYSKGGGTIKIESLIKNDMLVLTVQDSGIGLTGKDKKNLFTRFYRGEEAKKMNTDGMGLGLYIAHEIIRRHKGLIKAYSKGEGKGSVFSIAIPAKK